MKDAQKRPCEPLATPNQKRKKHQSNSSTSSEDNSVLNNRKSRSREKDSMTCSRSRSPRRMSSNSKSKSKDKDPTGRSSQSSKQRSDAQTSKHESLQNINPVHHIQDPSLRESSLATNPDQALHPLVLQLQIQLISLYAFRYGNIIISQK